MNGRTRVSRRLRGRQESVWQNACVPWLEGAEAGHAGVKPDCKPIDTVCLLQTICIKANRIYSIYVPNSELFKLQSCCLFLMGIRHKDTKKMQSLDKIYKKCEEYRNKKTSKLSRTPRPCKKSLKGFSFKLRQCYLKINLSLYLKNKTSITYSENFKIQFLPLPNLPIYSKHLAYEKNLFSILLPNN